MRAALKRARTTADPRGARRVRGEPEVEYVIETADADFASTAGESALRPVDLRHPGARRPRQDRRSRQGEGRQVHGGQGREEPAGAAAAAGARGRSPARPDRRPERSPLGPAP